MLISSSLFSQIHHMLVGDDSETTARAFKKLVTLALQMKFNHSSLELAFGVCF